MNKFKYLFFSILVSVLGFGNESLAYSPPSQYILKNWVKQHSGLKNLKVRSNLTVFENDKPSGSTLKETTFYNLESATLRSWITDESDQKLFAIEKSISTFSPAAKLLFLSDSRMVTQALKEISVPIRTDEELMALRTEVERFQSESVGLGRWNGAVAWVVGTQLWFEKDRFLPMKLSYSSAQLGDAVEVHFEHFQYFRDLPYPRSITVLQGKQLKKVVSQMTEVSSHPDMAKQFHQSFTHSGFTPAASKLSSDVKKAIQFYYDTVR